MNEFAAYDDSFIPSLRKLADAAKSGGALALLQIFHAGNKALPGFDVVSVSTMTTEATPLLEKLWNVIQAMPGWFTVSK